MVRDTMIRLARRTLAVWALVVTVPTVLMTTAAAADTTVEVDTPVGSFFRPGTETVLLVTVAADQAVTGSIHVLFEGEGITVATVDIEVPGGSIKTFAVPVTVSPWGGPPTVRVETSDGQTRRPVVGLQQVGDVEPVAVMPSLIVPGLPERAEMVVGLGQARLVPFDPALLDHGSATLNAASAVVANAADVVNLSEPQRAALFGWVSSGGNLYVDGSVAELESSVVGATLAAAGVGFEPEQGSSAGVLGRAWLGSGTVHATGDMLNAGRFDGLIQPRFSVNVEQDVFIDPGEVLSDLSIDAGFTTRPIGAFVAVLLAYIALVGPVLWFFLSRSRREPLMWLAIPGLAALMSLAIWGSGQFFRQGTTGSHVTITGSSGTASRTISDYMVSSSRGGFTGVELTDGWSASSNGFSPWDWRFQQAGFASPTVQGTRVGADVPPAGVVVLGAASESSSDRPWGVELSVDGSSVEGVVTNHTDYPLSNVSVFSGDRLASIADVPAGGSTDFRLDNISAPPMWENPVQMQLSRQGGRNSAASPAALNRWMAAVGFESRTGQITVIGWTKDAAAPLSTLGGSSVTRGRTGFVSSYPISQLAGDASISPATVRTRIVDWRWSGDIGGGMVSEERRRQMDGDVQTISYSLPPGADVESLVLEVPADVSAVDLWNGDTWIDARVGSADPGIVLVNLPASAVGGGSIYIRALVDGPFSTPTIRTATAAELAEAIFPPAAGGDGDGGGV
ncbi:MAG: hypothetical protein OES24_08985 [Acidimicrobiia bacterium]|nr:hypothetical protein [Acidimicrobiia bacterium]